MEKMGIAKKVLLIPDAYYTKHSGAIAARKAASLFEELGAKVAIFTTDTPHKGSSQKYYHRVAFSGLANLRPQKYRDSFREVLDDYKPDLVFYIGGIYDKPVVYLKECNIREIKTAYMLLVQDFYCTRLHAGLGISSCTKCLDGSNFNALINNCLEKGSNKYKFFFNYQLSQRLFLSELKKIDWVIGSTDEQLDFYIKIGIRKASVIKIPLFFEKKRLNSIMNLPIVQDKYFVILAQNRIEKGIHLITEIVKNLSISIKIKILFYNDDEANLFIDKYPENKNYIKDGRLELIPNMTMTNGAVELIKNSRGVINPTIWATTTEFVLLEVLGLSKPIITFNVGVHKEKIQHRKNGIVIKCGDFQQMSKEILDLLLDDKLYKNICLGARELYEDLTNDDIYKKKLKELL